MAAQDNPTRKPIAVDDAILRAFARGQLDEATEDRIVALLEERPELQDKVAAISTDGILSKMKAHREVLASKSLSSQIGVGSSVGQSQQDPAAGTAPQAPLDLPAELSELTDYRIIKELGRGGMGVVYLAEHTLTGRKEVLKVLNERLMNHSEAKKRFEQEIRCIASVDHDAIVRCYTVRMMPRTIVLAMEHVPGSDLHQFIARNGRLPLHVACGITTEVCSGLQHAMGVGLVHRDIKPSNIMVYKADGKLRAKILDFGLGRPAESNSGTGLTQDGTLLGTLEYVSPEQSMDANKVDIRSDIYSLGCTLYHMLVGHPPFSGSQGELIMAHAQKTPPSINLIHPELPVELADVVARMMAKEPSRRYATPREVAVALKPFLSRKRGETASPSLGMRGAPETHRPIAAEVDTSVEAGSGKQQPTATAAAGVPRFVVEAGKLGSDKVDSPAPKTLVVAQLVPQRSRGRKRKPRNPLPAVALGFAVSLALVGAILGIIQIRTPNGTIVIENLPADAEVLVDGENVQINWDGQRATVTAKPGERMVEVKQGDLAIEGERVVVRSGDKVKFIIRHAPDLLASRKSSGSTGQADSPGSFRAIEASPASYGPTYDLLPLIDPKHDLSFGFWVKDANQLIAQSPIANARIRIPFRPGEEYDFITEFTVTGGNGTVCQLLSARDTTFDVGFGGWKNTVIGISTLDGKPSNQTGKTLERVYELGKRHRGIVKVRRDRLIIEFDGKEILQQPTDYTNLTTDQRTREIGHNVLGVCADDCVVTFHKIEVRTVSGEGVPIKRFDARALTDASHAFQNVKYQSLLHYRPVGYQSSYGAVFGPLSLHPPHSELIRRKEGFLLAEDSISGQRHLVENAASAGRVTKGDVRARWIYNGGSFVMQSDGTWLESKTDGNLFEFEETSRSADFVELRRKPPEYSVRLYDTLANILREPTTEYVSLFDGSWEEGARSDNWIASHAVGSIMYEIPPNAIGFQALGAHLWSPAADGRGNSFTFRVFVDDQESFVSPTYRQAKGDILIQIGFPPDAKKLELLTDPLGDLHWDQAVWGEPVFVFPNEAELPSPNRKQVEVVPRQNFKVVRDGPQQFSFEVPTLPGGKGKLRIYVWHMYSASGDHGMYMILKDGLGRVVDRKFGNSSHSRFDHFSYEVDELTSWTITLEDNDIKRNAQYPENNGSISVVVESL